MVSNEVKTSAESFCTFVALMRTFSDMNFLVLRKLRVTEEFPTFSALLRPLSSVNPFVLNEARVAGKGFPTYPTKWDLHDASFKGKVRQVSDEHWPRAT